MRKRRQLFNKLLASILSFALALTGIIPQGMSQVQAAGETDDGLMLYYDFDLQNSFATEIPDASGNNNVGNIKRIGGSPEGNYQIIDTNIYGKKVKALSLPGGDDGTYLQMPNGILKDCDAVTISMWVKLTTDTGYQRIWDFGADTNKYMYLLSDGWNSGAVGYSAAITKEGWQKEKGVSKYAGNKTEGFTEEEVQEASIDKNRWVLTTVVMDGSSMSLYENGEQVKQTADTGITVKELGNTANNYIGLGQFGDAPTKGQFAEVKIYNKALTSAQIKAMYDVDDAGIVTADNGDLDLGDTSAVTEDITLPTKGVNGSKIVWFSQNSAIAIQESGSAFVGKVTRPAQGTANATGTLTAKITYGKAQAEKKFNVTVLAEYTDQQRIDLDAKNLKESMEDLSAVTADFTIPTVGELGSVITWESTNPAVSPDNGTAKVTRPAIGSPNATGTLKATVSYGQTAKKVVEFAVTVLAFREAVSVDTVEEVNVTTLVGRSPSLPNYVKATYTDGTKNKVKVKWPAKIDASKYAAAGTFTVEGVLIGEKKANKEIKVTANVTVVSEDEVAKTVVSDSFDLSDITLDKIGEDGSILTQNRDRDIAYLKLLDNKRMLYNFYKTFGKTAEIEGVDPLGGWDEPMGLLRGHSTGHYISALALAYGSTGDAEIKTKLDDMVHELRELQKLSKGDPAAFETSGLAVDGWSTDPNEWGEGFLSGYSPDQFALLEQGAPYGSPNSGIWAPYYTLHKLIAGFLDAYKYAGNEEALEAAKGIGMWATKRLSACSQEQLDKMWASYIAGEFGGFNESLAQLYIYAKRDGDADAEEYLKGAKLFDNTNFFNSLANNVDSIQGKHANQHIPQIIGAMEIYDATVAKGTPEMKYYNIAENFWQMVVSRYAYSIGGVGTGEKFTDPYEQAANIAGTTNCETCAAYNMLKLTRMLNNYDPDNAEYMDYYERTLYNQILASQTPNVNENGVDWEGKTDHDFDIHNGTTYMLPIGPGSQRSFGDDYNSFTCCHGTGMENHVKYQEAAYAKTDDTLYVGLYLPTTLTWEEKGVKVVQETTYPSEDTKLTVSALEGKTAQAFDMKLRVPYWATNGFTVKKNGTVVDLNAEASTYVTLEGVKADDVIEIHMPWTLHLDKTPDKLGTSEVASVMYGPFVMAAPESSTEWKTLKLSSDLSSSIKVGEKDSNGFPTLTTNGYTFSPMFAPQFATAAYDAYFKIFTVADDGNYFDVKVENYTPEKGSFTVDEVVKEGEDLMITAVPKSGYAVQMLVVNGQKVQIGSNNTYTVENVKGNVNIVGSFCSANPPTPDKNNLEYTASVTSDYTAGWENLEGIKTNWEPTKSKDGTGKGWGNWSQASGSEHYVQYMWDSEVTMNHFDIFWYDDGEGTRIPASMKIMYIAEDGTWQEANMQTAFNDILEVDAYNTVWFDDITTIAVKLVLTVRDDAAANGIYRWKASKVETASSEDKAELKETIDAAEAKKQEESKYTASSWEKFQAALDKVKEVYDNKFVSKAEVEDAKRELDQAIAGLQEKADQATRDSLKGSIDKIKVTDKDKYTPESWSRFEAALETANALYNDANAAKEDVEAAKADLDAAIQNLKPVENQVTENNPPAAPTNVKAAWTGKKNIKVTWNKAANAEKYEVYRSYKKDSGYAKIATITANSYTDSKSTAGKTAYYKIVSLKGTAKSAYSSAASAYKLKAPAKVKAKVKKRTLTLTYSKESKASGYEIYRATKKNGKYKKVATIKKAKTTKKVFKKMKKGTYYYKVRAYKSAGKKKIYTDYSKTVRVKVK